MKKLEGHLYGDNVTKLAVEDDKKEEDSDNHFEEEVGTRTTTRMGRGGS